MNKFWLPWNRFWAASMAVAFVLPAFVLRVGPAEAAERQPVFWMQDGQVHTGWAKVVDGRVVLTVMLDGGTPRRPVSSPVSGKVASVSFTSNGRRVSWYDTGSNTFYEFRRTESDQIGWRELAVVPEGQVKTAAWLAEDVGRNQPGPIALLDFDSDPTRRERWAGTPAGDQSFPPDVVPMQFTQRGRNISKFVTAATPFRGSPRALIAVRPYTVQSEECGPPQCESSTTVSRRVPGTAYLAEVNADLEVVRRVGTFPGATSIALSAGQTRIAFVTPGGRVQVRSFPDLRRIASYPGVPRSSVSFSSAGDLSITGPSSTVIRDAGGSIIRTPAGVTWLRYGPCAGKGCSRLP